VPVVCIYIYDRVQVNGTCGLPFCKLVPRDPSRCVGLVLLCMHFNDIGSPGLDSIFVSIHFWVSLMRHFFPDTSDSKGARGSQIPLYPWTNDTKTCDTNNNNYTNRNTLKKRLARTAPDRHEASSLLRLGMVCIRRVRWSGWGSELAGSEGGWR
jgi:hypothetical protein